MDQFFKTIGILATLAALSYGAYQLHQSKGELIDTFFWGFGILTFGLLIVGGLAYARYGKYWPIKFYAGKKLADSVEQLFVEIEEGKGLQKDTKAEVLTQVFWRFTRIGVFAILLAGLPVFFLWQQNILFQRQNNKIEEQTRLFTQQNKKIDEQTELFKSQNKLLTDQNTNVEKQTTLFEDQNGLVGFQNRRLTEQIDLMETQNDRLNLQNNLIEADRRSSLVFLMSNILDKVDEEIKEQRDSLSKKSGFVEDKAKYKLSKPLISRIIGLSRAFKPYRVMQGDTLSKELQSPERGQLFIALMENNLDHDTQKNIVSRGDFSNATIGKIKLHNADLRSGKFSGANLSGADFTGSNLAGANLINANLTYARLMGAKLIFANFFGADLRETDFRDADLSYADLSDTELSGAIFCNSPGPFRSGDLSCANLTGIDLHQANFNGANLSEVRKIFAIPPRKTLPPYSRKLTKEQLFSVGRLYKCTNLDPQIEKQLRTEKPCLFTEKGCN